MTKQHLQLEPPPHSLQTPLIQLHSYYKDLVEEYTRLAAQASEQLAHIEALLQGWHPQIKGEHLGYTNDSSPQPGLELVAAPSNTIQNQLPEKPDSDVMLTLPYASIPTKTQDETIAENGVKSPDILTNQDEATSSYAVDKNAADINTKESKATDSIELLPNYQGVDLFHAIEKVLQEHLGSILHVDFIIRELYGSLNLEIFNIAATGVKEALSAGVKDGRWLAVPDEPGCYSLDRSYEADETADSPAISLSKSPIPFGVAALAGLQLNPEYRSVSTFSDAIRLVLQKKKPSPVTNSQLIQEFFGNQVEKLDRFSKERVTKAFSNVLCNGNRKRGWVRVNVGVYKAID